MSVRVCLWVVLAKKILSHSSCQLSPNDRDCSGLESRSYLTPDRLYIQPGLGVRTNLEIKNNTKVE